MNNNYNKGGYPQSGRSAAKKETPVNKVELTGIAKPRGNYDSITVNQLDNGSATVKFTIECSEFVGADEQGNPKVSTTFVPVSVWANKIISVAMLRSVVAGMKVHVVGRWKNRHYKDRNGQDKNFTECEAYVLEILQQPLQTAPQQYPQPQPQYYQQYPQYQQPQYPQQPPQYPQYPQAQPQYQQQVPQYPQQPQQPQYPQQPQRPQQAPQQQAPAAGAQQQQPAPPYYQPPQQQQAAAQQPVNAGGVPIDLGQDDIPFP